MSRIQGIGTAFPPIAGQTTALEYAKPFSCKQARQERVLEELYRKTEISTRSSILVQEPQFFQNDCEQGPSTRARMEKFAEKVSPLAEESGSLALLEAGINAEQITHLVTVTCTGFFAPGFDIALIERLSLSPEVTRSQIGFMGCHGTLNAMKVVRSICQADANAVILLCAAEICSVHFQYGWEANNVIANSLFSDGAAALVVSNSPKQKQWQIAGGGSCIVPNSQSAMQWRIGDHGFMMNLSPDVPGLIEKHLRCWIERWLDTYGHALDGIKSWAIHPGGPRILDAVQESLNLTNGQMAPSRSILSEHGNMSSPSVIFALQRLMPGNGPCVMLGFGPGLAIEAVLLL